MSGIVAHQRNEIAPLDHQQFAVGLRDRVGGARLPVEQRDLAENLAVLDQVEHCVLARRGGRGHLHGAAAHRKQRVAGIALGEDDLAARDLAHLRVGGDVLQHVRRKLCEQRIAAKQRDLVGNRDMRTRGHCIYQNV